MQCVTRCVIMCGSAALALLLALWIAQLCAPFAQNLSAHTPASKMSVARKKKEAAQRVIKLEYSQHTTPTRNQITTVFTTPAVTKTWIGKRIKEVRHMNVCSA